MQRVRFDPDQVFEVEIAHEVSGAFRCRMIGVLFTGYEP